MDRPSNPSWVQGMGVGSLWCQRTIRGPGNRTKRRPKRTVPHLSAGVGQGRREGSRRIPRVERTVPPSPSVHKTVLPSFPLFTDTDTDTVDVSDPLSSLLLSPSLRRGTRGILRESGSRRGFWGPVSVL